MFEKEAEEYTMKKICKNCTYRCYTENILKSNKLDCFSYARGYKIFKDGAEFGYNKAKEELTERLDEAKEIIEKLYNIIPASMADYAKEPMEHARKFLTEEADK